MIGFFTFILTLILVCTSIFLIVVILMQRPSANAGMGASLGGGAAESAFGSDTTKVLTKCTIRALITFFIVALSLAILNIYRAKHKQSDFQKIDISNIISQEKYIVKKGDTLNGIAYRFYGKYSESKILEIQRINNIKNPAALSIGQELIIPVSRER